MILRKIQPRACRDWLSRVSLMCVFVCARVFFEVTELLNEPHCLHTGLNIHMQRVLAVTISNEEEAVEHVSTSHIIHILPISNLQGVPCLYWH